MKFIIFISILSLGACASYKGLSNDPAKMNSDTLCYRAETNSDKREAYKAEIRKRNLDCRKILESDPLYRGYRRDRVY